MYKSRSRYIKHLQKHGRSKGTEISNYKGTGIADIYRQGSDYWLKIGHRQINLGHFNSRKDVQQYARRKIQETIYEEKERSRYIRKIDGKLFNLVPDRVFLQKL